MERIRVKVWSHSTTHSRGKQYIGKVLSSQPKLVSCYRELVQRVATITYNNPIFNLFFRGQNNNHRNADGAVTIMPSIYRNVRYKVKSGSILKRRFEVLSKAEELLVSAFREQKIEGHDSLHKFKEIKWAILQHYQVCDTPLLDLTISLRVACSFAFDASKEYGYVYLLGFPNISSSISYSVEEELLNVKLSSICPPMALRPYFQEGYLVGSFPFENPPRSWVKLDVARRVIAIFKLSKQKFWDSNFTEIPEDALYPNDDTVEDICNDIRDKLKKLTNQWS